jgi:dTMP kinase
MPFIVVDGMDGTFKTTVVEILGKHIQRALPGKHITITKEPGGTPLGGEIRKIVTCATSQPLSRLATLLLFLADRAENVISNIAWGLDGVVLCDRYSPSTFVYQYSTLLGDSTEVKNIRRFFEATEEVLDQILPTPDAVYILLSDSTVALERAAARDGGQPGFYESRGVGFQHIVRDGYYRWVERARKKNTSRVVVINVTEEMSSLEVAAAIWEDLRTLPGISPQEKNQ